MTNVTNVKIWICKYLVFKHTSWNADCFSCCLTLWHMHHIDKSGNACVFERESLHDLEYLWLPHAGFPHQAHYNMPQTPVPTITNTNKKRQTVRHFLKMSDMLFPSHIALCLSLSSVFSNLSSTLAFPPTLVFGIFSCSFLRHHMMSDTFQTQPVHTSEMGVAKIYLYLGLSDTSVAMTLSKSNKAPYRKSKIKLVPSYPQIGLFMTENRKTISVLQSLPLQH